MGASANMGSAMTAIKFDRSWNGVSWIDYAFAGWTETAGTRFTRVYEIDGYELTLVGNFGMTSGRPSETSHIFSAEIEDANGDTMISVSGIDVTFREFRNIGAIPEYAYGSQILTYIGSNQYDYAFGTDGDDTISGYGGNDEFFGNDGRDKVSGGNGNDIISGGDDRDTLLGGAGVDRFVFHNAHDSSSGKAWRDRILDFRHGVDVIDLRTVDAIEHWNKHGTNPNNKFTFIGKEEFSGDLGELRFEVVRTASLDIITIIHGDIKGSNAPEFQIELEGRVNLTSTDFLL